MSSQAKSLIIVFFTALLAAPALASDTYILYSLEADLNNDSVPERVLVRAKNSSDPSKEGPKDFVIFQKSGEKYKAVYRETFQDGFYTKLARFQWESPSDAMPGLSIRKGSNGQEVWVVFATGSDHFFRVLHSSRGYKIVR